MEARKRALHGDGSKGSDAGDGGRGVVGDLAVARGPASIPWRARRRTSEPREDRVRGEMVGQSASSVVLASMASGNKTRFLRSHFYPCSFHLFGSVRGGILLPCSTVK